MIFADTGYFIALLDKQDSLHQRALNWSRSISSQIIVTEFVFVELFNYFSNPTDRPHAHELYHRLRIKPQCNIVSVSSTLFDSGISLHAARPDKEWSLTDCISFIVMEEHGVSQALAYDHHFEQAGFEALLRRKPLTTSP